MGKTKTVTKTDQNQTQTAAPPAWTAPGLVDAGARVTAAMNQLPTTHYSGPMVASMDPTAVQNIMNAWGQTGQNAGNLAGWMQNQLPQLTANQNFSTQLPDTSYSLAPKQELDNVIRASIAPVQRQLMEQILPSLNSSALDAGAYSGDRAMKVLPGQALQQFGDTAGNIAANLGYEDYNNYENRRLQAYGMQTQAGQQNYSLDTARQQEQAQSHNQQTSILHNQASQGDLLQMAAQLEQQQRQSAIANATGMDQYASQSPFMGLDTASQLLATLSGRYGTDTMQGHSTSVQTQSQPLGMQLLQGALGIGSLAMGMPGGAGGIGALLGGGAKAASGASSLFNVGGGTSAFFNAHPFGG
jgi:hypothetical protein